VGTCISAGSLCGSFRGLRGYGRDWRYFRRSPLQRLSWGLINLLVNIGDEEINLLLLLSPNRMHAPTRPIVPSIRRMPQVIFPIDQYWRCRSSQRFL